MEKDEKIRRRQGRQTQVLVLGVVVLLVLGIGLVSIQTHDHDSGTAPHHSLSNIRHHNSALLAHHETATKVEHSLADIRQHSAIAKEDHAHDGHADKKVLNSIRRHVHHPPESDVEAEVVLVERVAAYDAQVRLIKDKVTADGGFMETDPAGVAATQALQEATRLLLVRRYGVKEGIRVQVDLAFQPSNPTYSDARGPTDRFTLELAPRTLMPHAVYTFLEIARQWDTHQGAFHRNANHVLQVLVKGNAVPHLAFQGTLQATRKDLDWEGVLAIPCTFFAGLTEASHEPTPPLAAIRRAAFFVQPNPHFARLTFTQNTARTFPTPAVRWVTRDARAAPPGT
jgi:hypothetical protein